MTRYIIRICCLDAVLYFKQKECQNVDDAISKARNTVKSKKYLNKFQRVQIEIYESRLSIKDMKMLYSDLMIRPPIKDEYKNNDYFYCSSDSFNFKFANGIITIYCDKEMNISLNEQDTIALRAAMDKYYK